MNYGKELEITQGVLRTTQANRERLQLVVDELTAALKEALQGPDCSEEGWARVVAAIALGEQTRDPV